VFRLCSCAGFPNMYSVGRKGVSPAPDMATLLRARNRISPMMLSHLSSMLLLYAPCLFHLLLCDRACSDFQKKRTREKSEGYSRLCGACIAAWSCDSGQRHGGSGREGETRAEHQCDPRKRGEPGGRCGISRRPGDDRIDMRCPMPGTDKKGIERLPRYTGRRFSSLVARRRDRGEVVPSARIDARRMGAKTTAPRGLSSRGAENPVFAGIKEYKGPSDR